MEDNIVLRLGEKFIAWCANDEEAYLKNKIDRLKRSHGHKDWRGRVIDNTDAIKQHEEMLKRVRNASLLM